MGDYQGAIADYTDAVKLNPNMEGAFLNRGSVRFASGNYDDAIRDYSLAIQLKPDHDDAFYFRGLAEYQSGRYQNAISDCSEQQRIFGNHIESPSPPGILCERNVQNLFGRVGIRLFRFVSVTYVGIWRCGKGDPEIL